MNGGDDIIHVHIHIVIIVINSIRTLTQKQRKIYILIFSYDFIREKKVSKFLEKCIYAKCTQTTGLAVIK